MDSRMEDFTFEYLRSRRFFAAVARGVEELAKDEAEELGALEVRAEYRGISFQADSRALYRMIYEARLPSRILAALLTFDCHSTKYLYQTARRIHWPSFFKLDETFSIAADVTSSAINHSKYASLCLKDAIVDQYRDATGQRPSVDRENPDLWLHLRVHQDRAVISVNVSGLAMHKRGYRKESVAGPMQETLAAAIVRLAELDGSKRILDPMCGSGTLLCEALMYQCRIPAGYLRDIRAVRFLPDYDEALLQEVKTKADDKIRSLAPGMLRGGDIARASLRATRTNLDCLPHGDQVSLELKDFREIDAVKNAVIISNPPYGLRMGRDEDMAEFIKDLGDFLKQRCTGTTAYVYFGDRDLIKKLGLKTTWKKELENGGLDGRLTRVDLY